MKFSDLDDFTSNQMSLVGENFQQIVIATLVQNGGTATLNELQEELQRANPESDLNDISRSSVIGIITNPVVRSGNVLYNGQKIAKRNGDMVEMLDFERFLLRFENILNF